MKTNTIPGILGLSLLVAVSAGSLTAQTPCPDVEIIATGLLRPGKIIQTPGGNLLVAENGPEETNSGRVSIVDPQGNRRTLLDGLPSARTFIGDFNGTTGLFLRERTLYVVNGQGDVTLPGPVQGTQRANPTPASPIFSSVLAVEFPEALELATTGFDLTPADHEALKSGTTLTLMNAGGESATIRLIVDFPDYAPEPRPDFADHVRHSHPYGIVADNTHLYVVDAGFNTVRKVEIATGAEQTLASFPPTPSPLPAGPPVMENVPTSIHWVGGQLLVTTLGGAPFLPGYSKVLRINPQTGASVSVIEDLTTAIDSTPLIPGNLNASLLTLEHNLSYPQPGFGRLQFFATPGSASITNSACLVTPSSMLYDTISNRLILAELSTGRLVSMELPVDQSPPPVTVRFSQAVSWTTKGNDIVWLTVERGSEVELETFTVEYGTSDGTAKAGLDYEAASSMLNFAANERKKTFPIKILNDERLDNEKTFRVTLRNPVGDAKIGTPATTTVRILQDSVLRAIRSSANLTHAQERESVTFSFTSVTGPISVRGDLPELGNNTADNALRLVRGTDSVWSATVSLPVNRAYNYQFYRGNTPLSDSITAQTQSVSRQPAAKTLYYRSSLSNPVLNWRQSSSEGTFTATPMLRIGPGREAGEGLWVAGGVGESGRGIEFFIAESAEGRRDPALGSHWTSLDVAFLQDEHLFNYMPAATVSPHRRDYNPKAPPAIRSAIFGVDRNFRVMLPRGYAEHPHRRYPVIYFHDGGTSWDVATYAPGRGVVDPEGDIMAGLIRRGIMGEVIGVGIDIEEVSKRARDYLPPGDQGAADRYVDFIIKELKPLIDSQYRTRPGPESTFTVGRSIAALAALYMGWEFPHVFSRVGLTSGSFGANNFTAQVKREPKRDIRIYLDSGEDNFSDVLALRDNLASKSSAYVVERDLRYVYARGQQHVLEDFASRYPAMLSFIYPATEEKNELVPQLDITFQDGIHLRIAGPAGLPGRLQRSADLREWSDWQSLTLGAQPVEISAPQTSSITSQFYRLVTP